MTAEYYIWLQQVLGFASETVSRVLSAYGTAKAFYNAPDEEKIIKCRLNKVQAERLHSVPRRKVYSILNESAKSGINIITPEDAAYPKRLLNIPDPPAVLYIKGDLPDTDGLPVITVVGPRKISSYGEKCAYVISNSLASCGFTVVSGGAVGGDKAAHLGALEAETKTIAVLGCGINSDYLKCNADLRDRISENGCLVSEYPPSTGVKKGAFQQRNRILSGLSDGVVVVEGGSKSGTLITARCAVEQGRDVFVIPGSPSLPQYEGSNRLLTEGAKPLLSINGIIEEYLYKYPSVLHAPKEKLPMPEARQVAQNKAEIKSDQMLEVTETAVKQTEIDTSMLSETASSVVSFLRSASLGDFTVDDIVDGAGIDIGDALSAVTELEILGVISSLPGGRFKRS